IPKLPSPLPLKPERPIMPPFYRSRDAVGTLVRGSIRIHYRIVPRTDTGVHVRVQIEFAPSRLTSNVRRNLNERVHHEVYRTHQDALVKSFGERPDTLTLMVLYRGPDEGAEARIRGDLPRALDALVERLRQGWDETE